MTRKRARTRTRQQRRRIRRRGEIGASLAAWNRAPLSVGHVRFYDRALTDEEITAEFAALDRLPHGTVDTLQPVDR